MFLLQLQQIQTTPTDPLPVFAVARSETVELLKELYINELATPYEETLENEFVIKKSFRKGGPLEWYLPLDNPADMFVNIGTKESREEAMRVEIRRKLDIEWAAIEANTDICNTREELQRIINMETQNV